MYSRDQTDLGCLNRIDALVDASMYLYRGDVFLRSPCLFQVENVNPVGVGTPYPGLFIHNRVWTGLDIHIHIYDVFRIRKHTCQVPVSAVPFRKYPGCIKM